VKSFEFKPAADPRFVKGVCAELFIDGKKAGVLGKLNDKMTRGMRVQTPVFAAVVQLAVLFEAEGKSIDYEPVSQFPPVSRDVAFLAPKDLDNQQVLDFIAAQKIPNLVKAEIFDLFMGEPLPEGAKSMAYTLTFRSMERTLTDVEVNAAHEKLRDSGNPADGKKNRPAGFFYDNSVIITGFILKNNGSVLLYRQ